MKRREFTSVAGLAGFAPALAGCTALLGTTACEPAADLLGDVDAARPIGDTEREYRFRGTVVAYLDEGVLVDDTTGKAHLVPGPSKQRINRDLVSVGGCIEGQGSLDRERSRANGMAVLEVSRADFEALGDSTMDVEPVDEHPDPDFGRSQDGRAVRITVVDGDGTTASNVFVAYGTETHPWSELDADTGPDDPLVEGASVTIDDPPGQWIDLQWRSPDGTWSHRVGMVRT